MLSKSIKKAINCLIAVVMVLSLDCKTTSAKSLNFNQSSLISSKKLSSLENYSSFKITNGYGAVAKTSITLTKGATADIDVNVKVTCITQDELINFIKNNKNLFSAEEYNQIIESDAYQNGCSTATLLNGILGLKFGNSSTNVWRAYKNVNAKEVNSRNNEGEELLKSLHDMTQKNYRLIGELQAVGKSYIPISTSYCFVEVSKVQFQDGNLLKVVNTKATIADATCSTSKVEGSSNNRPLDLVNR